MARQGQPAAGQGEVNDGRGAASGGYKHRVWGGGVGQKERLEIFHNIFNVCHCYTISVFINIPPGIFCLHSWDYT